MPLAIDFTSCLWLSEAVGENPPFAALISLDSQGFQQHPLHCYRGYELASSSDSHSREGERGKGREEA